MRPSVALVTFLYFLNAGLPVLALPTGGGPPFSNIIARNSFDAPFDIEARELGHGLEKRQWSALFKGIFKLGNLIGKAISKAKGLRGIKHAKQAHHAIEQVQHQQQQQQQQQQQGRRRHRRGLLHSQIKRRDHLNARRSLNELD